MVIDLQNVTVGYNCDKPILQNISLKFRSEEIIVLKGPSGSGKSSFLRILNRLIEPLAGNIFIDGQSLDSWPSTLLRRTIAFIQQTPVVVDGSVKDNLLMPFRFRITGDQKNPDQAALESLLETFLMTGVSLSDNALQLSIGQRQRVSIIRALLTSPKFLLMDEPTSALDQNSKEIVERCTGEYIQKSGAGMIMVTHQDNTPELARTRLLFIENGEILEREVYGDS